MPRLNVSAEPRFSAQPVEKIGHNAEPGEREDDCCCPHETCKKEPVWAIEPGKHGTEGQVHADKHIDVPFKIPAVSLHEVE